MQHGLIRRSDAIDDTYLAFMTKAINEQGFECAEAWDIDPAPLAFYAKKEGLPPRDVRFMSIVDDVALAGALGYHDDWAGIISAQVLAMGPRTSVIASHEHLEMLIDPHCNKWRTMPGGKQSTAIEVCDAVQEDTYTVDVEIFKEKRPVELSNYLLPSWFDPHGEGPFDRMGKLARPFTMSQGGYLIVKDDAGRISNVFAAGMPAAFAYKLANPISRTLRRAGNRGGL